MPKGKNNSIIYVILYYIIFHNYFSGIAAVPLLIPLANGWAWTSKCLLAKKWYFDNTSIIIWYFYSLILTYCSCVRGDGN